MSTTGELKKPYLVRGPQPASTTVQTRGMERRPGITADTVGASKIWLGLVTAAPKEKGPPHHHGEAETAVCVLSGHIASTLGRDSRSMWSLVQGSSHLCHPTYSTSKRILTTNHTTQF